MFRSIRYRDRDSDSDSDSDSENDASTSMEALSRLMKKQQVKGIVALTGLPSTCKTEVALRIGRWAKCPVLCIQDFLGGAGLTCKFKGAEAGFSPPTATDEVERHHRKAFDSLLAVALRHLVQGGWHFVVIKSSLNTPYELQQLLQLTRLVNIECRLIIMECKIKNKFLWKQRFEHLISDEDLEESRSWCRPRSWKDIEKALDDDDDDCAAHHHLPPPSDDDSIYVTWMGVDPFYDLSLLQRECNIHKPLSVEFNGAIKYLLTVPKKKLHQNPYVVEYDEFRRSLFDLKLSATAQKGRTEYFCERDCVFGYSQLPKVRSSCGVCQGKISKQPAYTCHFCVIALHKTCAEMFPTWVLQSTIKDISLYLSDHRDKKNPCKACQGRGKQFSKKCRSCILQRRLNCHLLPTILNHNSHPDFLSIQFFPYDCVCKACGGEIGLAKLSYGCKRCAFYCHLKCAFLPLELKQVHGGHDHVMKLMYTRDAMEEEEDPIWCDCCYKDIDPEVWFYTCQQCPHYVVHLKCSNGYKVCLNDPKMVKLVEQLQPHLDDWRAAGNSIQPC